MSSVMLICWRRRIRARLQHPNVMSVRNRKRKRKSEGVRDGKGKMTMEKTKLGSKCQKRDRNVGDRRSSYDVLIVTFNEKWKARGSDCKGKKK